VQHDRGGQQCGGGVRTLARREGQSRAKGQTPSGGFARWQTFKKWSNPAAQIGQTALKLGIYVFGMMSDFWSVRTVERSAVLTLR
jgi:hypothetical protein